MCGPLHCLQVDTLFEHIPQGRELAQAGNLLANYLDHEVDFLFGGKAADGESDGTVSQFILTSQGTQDIAGFETGRGAGGAGRGADIMPVHVEKDGLAFDVLKADVAGVGQPARLIAIDGDITERVDDG